jgi:teichuronic acid biosynthesis glycosyltransferase TuaH
VSAALPDVALRLVGPVEREPAGWASLVKRPNVRLEGRIVGEQLTDIIANAAALIVPHRVDDYSRSQDAMKAWDAIAVGTPVISTQLPPASEWPAGIAVVASDTASFIAAARSALTGDLGAARELRLDFARANGWSARAASVVEAIAEVWGGR